MTDSNNNKSPDRFQLIERLIRSQQRIIPLITIDRSMDCKTIIPPMIQALHDSGIHIIEITLRDTAGYAAIEYAKTHFPELMVAAGTVTSTEQVSEVTRAGADMIVSPGIHQPLLEACEHHNISILPGVSTASEILLGMSHGLRHLKFFPAEAAGGVPFLQALQEPFPDIQFCATGGISTHNAASYIALDNVFAVGSSQLITADIIQQQRWDAIRENTLKRLNTIQ